MNSFKQLVEVRYIRQADLLGNLSNTEILGQKQAFCIFDSAMNDIVSERHTQGLFKIFKEIRIAEINEKTCLLHRYFIG